MALFGRVLVSEATAARPVAIELTPERMDAIHEAAGELLEHSNDTLAQRRIVERLDIDTSLALCMWVLDPNLAEKLVARI